CEKRFLVTECLDAARAERRQALDQLQRQQVVLDEARRRERAAQRQRDIETRAAREHQRAVEERNARHDAQHKPAAGLPLPVPASAASR
ncbi:MAG: hypothetical protein CFE45_11060, partial [Burkholderiales bacterium PBB5]